MHQEHEQFKRFKSALRSTGPEDRFLLAPSENGFDVYYVPFEHVNLAAKLVLVGITPGPTQMSCAYAAARRLLATPNSDSEILQGIKRCCAFAGMRNRINEALDHFGIPRLLGVDSAELFWHSHFTQLFPTSIVPNAAFRNGKYFAGPFQAVLNTPLLRRQFEDVFIPSICELNRQALFLGLGPVVDEGLGWCASRSLIEERQILGYLPHVSGNSGSQFAYFLRKKRLSDLHPKDPVRHRIHDLDAAYARINSNLASLFPAEANNGSGNSPNIA
jgi:hypothetical protein